MVVKGFYDSSSKETHFENIDKRESSRKGIQRARVRTSVSFIERKTTKKGNANNS